MHRHYKEKVGVNIMKCAFDYCIYNKGENCILKDIEINEVGMCDSCIIVFLEHDFIEKRKAEHLEDIRLREKKDLEI